MVKRRDVIPLQRILGVAILLCAAFAAPAQTDGRLVRGTVFYERGEPAKEAAVQLRNPTTLQIVSQLTDAQGHFHFAGLDPDHDYEVSAIKNGRRSNVHSISRFSSKKVETVDLYLKEKADEK